MSLASQYVAEAPRADRRSPFPKPQMVGRGTEHVKWEYHDFVGKYHLRKIKSEFPIPGLTVTRKLKAEAAARVHGRQLEEWMKQTHKNNTAGMRLKTEAEADFLRLSDTGRASERVLAALAPAIEKRAEAFHKFTHADRTAQGRETAPLVPFVPPTREEDALELDYRRVDPRRDFRFGIMPVQRQREIHQLNLTRNAHQPKAVDVLSTDRLITAVAGERGPPAPVRETKTRALSAHYRRRSGFSRGRALRQEEAKQRQLERRAIAERRPEHRQLTRCASAQAVLSTSSTAARHATVAGAEDGRGDEDGGGRAVVAAARADVSGGAGGRSGGGGGGGGGGGPRHERLDVMAAVDDLRGIYHARPNTVTVATREFRRRNRFL